jgi:hypothetical protein
MRRLRKSVHPAMTDSRTAPARIAGLKRASIEARPNSAQGHMDVEGFSSVLSLT